MSVIDLEEARQARARVLAFAKALDIKPDEVEQIERRPAAYLFQAAQIIKSLVTLIAVARVQLQGGSPAANDAAGGERTGFDRRVAILREQQRRIADALATLTIPPGFPGAALDEVDVRRYFPELVDGRAPGVRQAGAPGAMSRHDAAAFLRAHAGLWRTWREAKLARVRHGAEACERVAAAEAVGRYSEYIGRAEALISIWSNEP